MKQTPAVSPSISELMLTRRNDDARPTADEIQGDDDLREIFDAAALCRQACERSAQAAQIIRSNQMQTALKNESDLRTVSFRNIEQATKKVDGVRARIQTAIKKIEGEAAAPPVSKDPVALMLASEIRAALLRMPEKQRGEAIAKAIQDGDNATVGAVLSAPGLLVGISEADREMRRHAWQQKYHKPAIDRVERLKVALADLDSVARLARNWTLGLSDHDAIKNALETEKAAREAAAA